MWPPGQYVDFSDSLLMNQLALAPARAAIRSLIHFNPTLFKPAAVTTEMVSTEAKILSAPRRREWQERAPLIGRNLEQNRAHVTGPSRGWPATLYMQMQ